MLPLFPWACRCSCACRCCACVLVAAAALGIVILCAGAAVVALAVLWSLPGHGVGGERGRLTRFLSLVPDCRWRLVVPVPRSVTHVTVHEVVAEVVIAAGHGQAHLRRQILLHIAGCLAQ